MAKNKLLFFSLYSMSINKAQALLLADGLLDDLGNEEFQPRESVSEFLLIAGEMVEDMQDNLKPNTATGKLSESILLDEPEQVGTFARVDIKMLEYGRFQNKGVKGTRSGKSLAGYKFRNDLPSKSHVDAIREWIKTAGLSVASSDVKKYGAVGQEKKNKSVSELDAAYAVARSIKQHGIKATGFLDKAAYNTSKKFRDRLGAALKIDVINSINPV